jgi:hypothetical protein
MFAWMGPGFVQDFHALAAQSANQVATPADVAPVLRANIKVMQLEALFMLCVLPAQAVLNSAIFRSVLEPDNKAFASLRVGRQELWLLLLILAFEVFAYLLFLVLCFVFVLLGVAVIIAFASVDALKPWTGWAAGAVGVIGFATYLWIVLRLSMAGPMTFAEREFRLFESWKLTKGNAWRLFALAVLLVLIVIGIALVLVIVMSLTIGFARLGATPADHAEQMHEFFKRPPGAWHGWVALWAVVFAFVEAAIHAILVAPWARAYQGLSARRQSTPVTLADPEPPPTAPVVGTMHPDAEANSGESQTETAGEAAGEEAAGEAETQGEEPHEPGEAHGEDGGHGSEEH